MIRGLSPIPRGGGKPEGKEGDCIPTLEAVSLIEGVWVRTKIMRGVFNTLRISVIVRAYARARVRARGGVRHKK